MQAHCVEWNNKQETTNVSDVVQVLQYSHKVSTDSLMINSNISTAIGKFYLMERTRRHCSYRTKCSVSDEFNFSFATFASIQILHLIQFCIVLKIQSFLGNAVLNF